MHRRQPSRLKGFDYRGQYRYSLRFRTANWARHFDLAENVSLVLSQILRVASGQRFAVLAYCFMPDHLHLVVAGEDAHSDLRAFLVRAKQASGFEFKKARGVRLWQRYAYERVLRSEEATDVVVRYVLENPVRAGLAAAPELYPFLGSSVYSLEELLGV